MKNFLHLVTLLLFLASCNNNSKTEADFKLIPVQSGQYWGYINHDGKFIINPQFANANPFYEGVALIKSSDGKYGYINEEGKYIINPVYKDATDFGNGLALVVKENSKLEFINVKGETKISLDQSVESAHKFSEGLALINVNNKFGYINTDGKIVIPAIFDDADDFSEGLARVGQYDSAKNETQFGFINKKGDLVINYQFKFVSNFKEGLALVNNGTQSGYIGKDGKFVINPQFDNVSLFEGDYAALKQGELWGFIDKKGKIIINPQYKAAGLFYDNDIAAVVSTDGKTGFIDKEGKYTINPQFDYATRFYGDMSIIKMGNKYGLINKKGNITINPQFDAINTGIEYNEWVNSDYFDANDVVSYIIESITDKSVNGFSATTTYKDLKVLYPNLNENNYSSFSDFTPKKNKFVQLYQIGAQFRGGLTTSTPNYTTQQVYDPVAGGYTNQQVYNGSTITVNPNASLFKIDLFYNVTGKGQNKKAEIIKALHDRFISQGLADFVTVGYTFVVENKNLWIRVEGLGDQKTLTGIILQVSFKDNSAAATADSTRVIADTSRIP